MSRTRIAVIVWLFSLLPASAGEVSLEAVLAHPKQYDRQRTTVRGFARVEGESFVLYRDAASAKRLDVYALSVSQQRERPLHDSLNNHWIAATGIIDAKAHGLWGFPCELLLEEAHVVRHQ